MKIIKFLPIMAILYLPTINADDLTPLEIQSSILSNTVTENRYPVSIIDGNGINGTQSIGLNLGSSINIIPGISNSDYGVAIGQPVIRGLGGSRVKVLSNNNYVSDLSYFSADHPNIVNLNNATHIEVIKGPSSIFNYSGTTGGIINVITHSITDKLYSDEKLTIGRTFDSVSEGYTNNILLKKNMRDISLYLSYDKRDHLDYDMPDGSLFDEGEVKHTLANSDFADKRSTIGLSLIQNWGYLGLSFENMKGTYGIPYHAEEEGEHEEEEHAARIYSTHKSDTYTFKGRFNNVPIANSLDFSYNNTNAAIKEHEEDGSFKTLNNNTSSMNLKLNMDTNEIERRVLIAHAHTKSPMSSNAYVPVSESVDRSIAYFSRTNLLGSDLSYAIRYDANKRHTIAGKRVPTYMSYEDSSISASANTSRQITDNLSYNIGFSHVSRSPNMAELFADGKHGPTNRYEKGNRELQKEISKNIDLTINFKHGDSIIDFSIFRNDVTDFIYLRDLGNKKYDGEHEAADWSQKDAVIQGYELSFEKSLPLGDNELLFTVSRDDISAVFDDDTYIPRIPSARNMLNITMLGMNNEKYSINLIHSEEQRDFSSIETRTNSYVDLGVKYSNKIQLNQTYDLNLNLFANNLLDQTIRNHASFVKAYVPLPGSSFGFDVSVDYKF